MKRQSRLQFVVLLGTAITVTVLWNQGKDRSGPTLSRRAPRAAMASGPLPEAMTPRSQSLPEFHLTSSEAPRWAVPYGKEFWQTKVSSNAAGSSINIEAIVER